LTTPSSKVDDCSRGKQVLIFNYSSKARAIFILTVCFEAHNFYFRLSSYLNRMPVSAPAPSFLMHLLSAPQTLVGLIGAPSASLIKPFFWF